MRVAKQGPEDVDELDMTPMIDMTFQLIAFFMMLANFSKVETNDKVKLPDSDLARPPAEVPDFRILLSVFKDGNVFAGGKEVGTASLLKPYLDREINNAKAVRVETSKIKVIIRSHRETKMGKIHEVIRACQDRGLEDFTLRVKEKKVFPGTDRFSLQERVDELKTPRPPPATKVAA